MPRCGKWPRSMHFQSRCMFSREMNERNTKNRTAYDGKVVAVSMSKYSVWMIVENCSFKLQRRDLNAVWVAIARVLVFFLAVWDLLGHWRRFRWTTYETKLTGLHWNYETLFFLVSEKMVAIILELSNVKFWKWYNRIDATVSRSKWK